MRQRPTGPGAEGREDSDVTVTVFDSDSDSEHILVELVTVQVQVLPGRVYAAYRDRYICAEYIHVVCMHHFAKLASASACTVNLSSYQGYRIPLADARHVLRVRRAARPRIMMARRVVVGPSWFNGFKLTRLRPG